MSWMDDELLLSQADNDKLKVNWLKWEAGKVKDLEVDFSQPFIKEKDGFDKLQVQIPVKEGNELKIWGVYPSNPIYHELLKAGANRKTKFKILMQKIKTKAGFPGNAFTILEQY